MKVPWTLFWVTEQTRPYRKIYYFQFQSAITHKKKRNPELRLLHPASLLMLLYICVKFHENISNSFWVTELTPFCDSDFFCDKRFFFLWQTDGQGKNTVSKPYEGRHKYVFYNYLLKSIQDFNCWKLRYQKCINIILGPEQNEPRHV